MLLTPYRLQNVLCGRRSRQRGISLLEVLISMFVMLVGVVSLFALVALGRFEMLEGSKADRAMSVARAAQRQLKITGALRPVQNDGAGNMVQMWLTPSGAPFIASPDPTMPFQIVVPAGAGLTPPLTYNSAGFVIDPIGVAANPSIAAGIDKFPADPAVYASAVVSDAVPAFTAPYTGRLYRMTLRSPATLTGLTAGAADVMFRSQDDLLLVPPVGDFPPLQLFTPSGSRRQSQGDYSWMATIVPAHGDPYAAIVSIIVFYKRVPLLPATITSPPPPERMVSVGTAASATPPAQLPLGIGGGDVQLTSNQTGSDYLTLKTNQWIMLSQPSYLTSSITIPAWYRWYKVIALDAIAGSNGAWTRNVTLAGPDWNTTPTSTTGPVATYASIVDGVVGVYEKQIELEESGNPWSNN